MSVKPIITLGEYRGRNEEIPYPVECSHRLAHTEKEEYKGIKIFLTDIIRGESDVPSGFDISDLLEATPDESKVAVISEKIIRRVLHK